MRLSENEPPWRRPIFFRDDSGGGRDTSCPFDGAEGTKVRAYVNMPVVE